MSLTYYVIIRAKMLPISQILVFIVFNKAIKNWVREIITFSANKLKDCLILQLQCDNYTWCRVNYNYNSSNCVKHYDECICSGGYDYNK